MELKKINDELMIVRGARAKLSAKDKKINLQGMNEQGPVQAILSHSKYEQFKHRCDLRQDAQIILLIILQILTSAFHGNKCQDFPF